MNEPKESAAPKERFTVVPVVKGDANSIRDKTVADHFLKGDFGKTPRLRPLANIIKKMASLNCETVLIQYPVQDPDFLAEFHAFYSKGFGYIDRYCRRLHFFSVPSDEGEDPLSFIDKASETKRAYLGFMTLRPVRSSPVGATFISANGDTEFLLCQDEFTVHLAGQEFVVSGTPFMQQDNAVGACAQAAIWMALRTVRKKQGTKAHNPAQITESATRFLATRRTLPNREGLELSQMVEAVRASGYSTHVMIEGDEHGKKLSPEQIRNAKLDLYPYIESGMPVILGLCPEGRSGHAVVMIGHGWSKAPAADPIEHTISLPSGTTVRTTFPATWINKFVIHNDNSGPYIDFFDTTPAEELFSYSLEDLFFAIPLMPDDVFISGEEAQKVSLEVLGDMLKDLEDAGIEVASLDRRLLTRTYLIDRHSFRKWALNSGAAPALVRKFRNKVLPRKLWVTEISLTKDYGALIDTDMKSRVGEIVLDPTGDPNDAPFLSAHLNIQVLLKQKFGLLLERDPDTQDITFEGIQDDVAYAPYKRSG